MANRVVSVNPHVYAPETTTTIMRDVIIALCPAVVASVLFFGVRSLLVEAVCVIVAVLCEWGFEKICKRPVTIGDLSAVVTGLLLALNLPVTIPLWQAAFGALVAIVVVKQLFGGIGMNFANPAITARIVMLVAFGANMTHWAPAAFSGAPADAVTAATPCPSSPGSTACPPGPTRWPTCPPCWICSWGPGAAPWARPPAWPCSSAAST